VDRDAIDVLSPNIDRKRWYSYALILGVIILGTYGAYVLKWHCDDIFITLRYADNFLADKGLVYNEGEYVEGYTHPLWLALLIICGRLGFNLAASSLYLGLASYVGVVLIFSLISRRLNRGFALFVPITAVILAIHRDVLIWATGGLETMFFTFLLSLAFWLYFFTDLADRRKLISVGLVLTLAVLTRPDGVLLFALSNVCLLISRRNIPSLIWFNLPAVCILAPYLLWKYYYYGQLLPNPYYVKSGGSWYFSRGFFYLWLYLKPYFSSWLFFLVLPAIVVSRRGGSRLTFVFLGVMVYIVLFVARVGGDFMYGRFVVPMIPFAMLAFEMAILQLWPRRRLLPVIAVAVVACSILFIEIPRRNAMLQGTRNEILGDGSDQPWFRAHKGMTDEHYTRTVVDPIQRVKKYGELLEPCFRDLDVTVVLIGNCCLGYYGRFKTCIEYFGLTDEYIARLPVEKRGRAGHEKHATEEYLVHRKADFILGNKWPFSDEILAFRRFAIDTPDIRAEGDFITYNKDLILALKERFGESFEYTDFEGLLDGYIETTLGKAEYQQLRRDYEDAKNYYFLHYDDKAREIPFLNKLRELEKSQKR